MTRPAAGLLVIFLLAPVRSARAQAGTEIGITALGLLADPAFGGGGLSAGVRLTEHTRLSLSGLAGAWGGVWAGRGELATHFLLSPRKATGVGVYAWGGIAGQFGPRTDRGYLLLGLGLDQAPGRRAGWMAELGVGGGVRLAVGWRRRNFAPR